MFSEFPSLVASVWEDLHINLECFQAEGCQRDTVSWKLSLPLSYCSYFSLLSKNPIRETAVCKCIVFTYHLDENLLVLMYWMKFQ